MSLQFRMTICEVPLRFITELDTKGTMEEKLYVTATFTALPGALLGIQVTTI